MKIQWEIRKNKELSVQEKNDIINLKEQYWKHGICSQLEWMDKNIKDGDIHLIARGTDGFICAYLNIVQLNVLVDERKIQCLGIGNVCVDSKYKHNGLGSELCKKANTIIREKGQQGILLCKKSLLPFYDKCNWKVIRPMEVYIESQKYVQEVMVYPEMNQEIEKILINRNF